MNRAMTAMIVGTTMIGVLSTQAADPAQPDSSRAAPINGKVATEWLYQGGWGAWTHFCDHMYIECVTGARIARTVHAQVRFFYR